MLPSSTHDKVPKVPDRLQETTALQLSLATHSNDISPSLQLNKFTYMSPLQKKINSGFYLKKKKIKNLYYLSTVLLTGT